MGCTVWRGERLQVTGPTQLRPLGTIDLNALPDAVLVYLLGSRYCDTDRLATQAWALFGTVEPRLAPGPCQPGLHP